MKYAADRHTEHAHYALLLCKEYRLRGVSQVEMTTISNRGLYELKGGHKSLLHRDKDQCSARVSIAGIDQVTYGYIAIMFASLATPQPVLSARFLESAVQNSSAGEEQKNEVSK